LRAFYGSHRATAESANDQKTISELQVQRGQANQFELKI